ncbi:hypothetical protein HI914_00076 [Erysiphe necator]|nr:hypothetical protein HI914_00076 [Erysiphe necator]
MSALVISGSGLDIKGFTTKSNNPTTTPKAFGISLSNRVIEDMIQCVRGGKTLQLSLDESPKILYGNKVQHFEVTDNILCHEIIRTSLPTSIRPQAKAAIPHPAVNTFTNAKMMSNVAAVVSQRLCPINSPVVNTAADEKPLPSAKESVRKNQDAAVVALQNSLATESLRKAENTVKYVKDVSLSMPSKRGIAKSSRTNISRHQSRTSNDFSGKTLPPSPSLNSSSVPLSQKQAEQAKAARKPVIHLLAVSPLTERELDAKIPESTTEDLKQTLDKVGDLNETTKKWELRKAFYKELDVWCFKYNCREDRQRAIDNAVKVFDKMRMNISEPQWEKLLPRSERGTGKCLSKLQAQIAQASSQKIPKNSEIGRDSPQKNNNKDDTMGEKLSNKVKGEPIVKTTSQGATVKTKKAVKEREAQAKRLLSKKSSGAKSASIKAANSKKTQSVSKDVKSSTILSSEYVDMSDEEDTLPSVSTIAKNKKRFREKDEASITEQNISPAKKVKESSSFQNRSSESSRTTSTGQFSFSSKSNKSNSPQISSSLATSPPTNASDLQDSSDTQSLAATSPRPHLRTTPKSPICKANSSKSYSGRGSSGATTRRLRPEVTNLARRYKMFYPKYLELYEQLTSMGDRRDRKMEKDLLDMHSRLTVMKEKILAGIINVSSG